MCPQVDTRISPMNIYITHAAKFDLLSCSPPNPTVKILINRIDKMKAIQAYYPVKQRVFKNAKDCIFYIK